MAFRASPIKPHSFGFSLRQYRAPEVILSMGSLAPMLIAGHGAMGGQKQLEGPTPDSQDSQHIASYGWLPGYQVEAAQLRFLFGGSLHTSTSLSEINLLQPKDRLRVSALNPGWNERSDLWSTGCIVMELYTGELLLLSSKGNRFLLGYRMV